MSDNNNPETPENSVEQSSPEVTTPVQDDPPKNLKIENPTPQDIAKILVDAFKTIDLAAFMVKNGEHDGARLVLYNWIHLNTPKLRGFDCVEQLLDEVWDEQRPNPQAGVSKQLKELIDKVPRFNSERLARVRILTVRDLRLVAQIPGDWSPIRGIGYDSLKRIREVLESHYKENIEVLDMKAVYAQWKVYEDRMKEDGRKIE